MIPVRCPLHWRDIYPRVCGVESKSNPNVELLSIVANKERHCDGREQPGPGPGAGSLPKFPDLPAAGNECAPTRFVFDTGER